MIRTASAEDAGVIARLCGQLGYPATGEQICHRMREILGREDHAVVVSEHGSSLVGWAHVSVRHLLESDPCAEICGFVVEEAHRGQGVGTELLEAVEDWARSQGRAARMTLAGRELRRWPAGGIFSPTAGTAGVARIRPDGLLRIGPQTP